MCPVTFNCSGDSPPAEPTVKKQRGRPFPKGQSGNPKGRPKGRLNKATQAALALLDGEGEAITRRCVDLAKEGDMTAMRLVMDRLIPPRRSIPIEVEIPRIESAADLPHASGAILDAAKSGQITLDEAQGLIGLVDQHRRSIETSELAEQVTRLTELVEGRLCT